MLVPKASCDIYKRFRNFLYIRRPVSRPSGPSVLTALQPEACERRPQNPTGQTGFSAEQSRSQTMTATVFSRLQPNNYFFSSPNNNLKTDNRPLIIFQMRTNFKVMHGSRLKASVSQAAQCLGPEPQHTVPLHEMQNFQSNWGQLTYHLKGSYGEVAIRILDKQLLHRTSFVGLSVK